jgi:hypothetical protein
MCGVYLGPEHELLPALPENEEGFWEHRSFVGLNDRILERLGGTWDRLPALEPGWERRPDLAPLRDDALALIARFAGREPWAWKDPRNSITLAFWRALLPDLKVIVCLRNPLEAAQSLRARSGSSIDAGLRLWTVYHHQLRAADPTDEAIVTHFASFFRAPQVELTRLLTHTGVEAPAAVVERACAAVSSGLRHQRAGSGPLDTAMELYLRLCAQAGGVYQPGDPASVIVEAEPPPPALERRLAAIKQRIEQLVRRLRPAGRSRTTWWSR